MLKDFEGIDIYVFDQLLRGRIHPGQVVLDAGCGNGRNINYMIQNGYHVMAFDRDERSLEQVRSLCAAVAPSLSEGIRLADADHIPFSDHSADVVMSIAVLHFAHDHGQFNAMFAELMRVLKPGGVFICRMASIHGMEKKAQDLGDGRFHLPDGTERYLCSEKQLLDLTAKFGGTLLDPLKTTVVHGLRAMTTWVFQKGS